MNTMQLSTLFQFSLRRLFAVVVFVAVACTALLHPTFWVGTIFALLLVTLGIAVLNAILARGLQQAYWIGFAVFGIGYFWIIQQPYSASDYDTFSRWGFRKEGPLVTTYALFWGYELLPNRARVLSVDDIITRKSSWVYLGMRPLQPDATGETITLESFMFVGQSLWTFLIACAGGWIGRLLYLRRRPLPNGG